MLTAPARSAGSVLFAVALAVGGAGLTLLAASDLLTLARGLSSGAPLLSVSTGAAAAIPTSVILLGVAVMLSLPAPANDRTVRRLFMVVLAMLPLLIVLPAALFVASRIILPERGYSRCPETRPGRFLTVDWYRGQPGACAVRGVA